MVTLTALVLLLAFAVIFALQNSFPVLFSFLNIHFEVSLSLVILVSFFAGFLVAILILSPSLLKLKWRQLRGKNG